MNNIKKAALIFNHFYMTLQGNNDLSDLSLTEVKENIQTVIDHSFLDNIAIEDNDIAVLNYEKDSYQDIDQVRALNILETCLSATNSDFNDLSIDEYLDLLEEVEDKVLNDSDYWLDSLPCGEVRIIKESDIDEIWHDSLLEQIKECYDFASTIDNLPSWVACSIDWDQTAENCKVDGKGHHFASYDGYEHNTSGYYIFRTN